MPTANFNLPIYGPTDTAALDTLLNGQSNAIDAALLATEWRAGGTDAQRTAMVAPRRKEGLQFYATDTNREWFYDGSNWLAAETGMYLVRPTTVTGATVSTDGTIVPIVGATTIDIDGAFTNRFRRYRVEYTLEMPSSSSHAVKFRRSGATIAATNEYNNQRLNSSNGSTSSSVATGAHWDLTTEGGLLHSGSFVIHNPRSSGVKFIDGVCRSHGGNQALATFAGINGASAFLAAVDGISIIIGPAQNSTTIVNSWFKIYGLV